MKLTRYILSLVSLLFIGQQSAEACGPYFVSIPTPEIFRISYSGEIIDEDRDENLLLWQKLTSTEIPVSDIEQVVYKFNSTQLFEAFDSNPEEKYLNNVFICYLNNSSDGEIKEFIQLAKGLEERRREHSSIWYYPSDPDEGECGDYEDLITQIRAYRGTRLADRYGLQLIRALFAAGKNDECINEYENRLSMLPADNLFRRMALNYVAGCWGRIGQTEKANEYFAKASDYSSIKGPDKLAYMAEHNPDAKSFFSEIGNIVATDDTTKVLGLLPLCHKILNSNKTKYRGDWLYLNAYIEGRFNGNYSKASRLIRKALSNQFAQPQTREYARVYRMITDAYLSNTSTLLDDLKWLETKISLLSPDAKYWNRVMRNIVQMHWVPILMENGDRTLAALLAGYSDNFFLSKEKREILTNFDYWSTGNPWQSISDVHMNPQWWNNEDYSNLTFQLMYAMTGDQLAAVKSKIGHGGALQRHLERYAHVDDDYLNELIGTIYLREQKYEKAARYLSRVSVDYQRRMNIYKGNYLARDPFFAYDTRREVVNPGEDYEWVWDGRRGNTMTTKESKDDAKLRFAKKMIELKHTIATTKDRDAKVIAQFDYAVGLRNSFEECWALTQYYRGCIPGMYFPTLDDYGYDYYAPLKKWFTYYTDDDQKRVESDYQKSISSILASTTDPETVAQLNLRLRNYKTIARCYPNTSAGLLLATSCDAWKDWIK